MSFFLAVDGGGTKTHVLCADETGAVVGEGLSGPTNLTATNVGAASFNLREALRQATEHLPKEWDAQQLVMGLAGVDTPEEHEQATEVFGRTLQYFPINNYKVVNDIVIGLASGTDKPNAVALIAGTGSNCYGRNQAGQEVKVGGMDYLLTDQGSGYQVGHKTLRAAVKSFDGRIPKSKLEQLVCEHFRIESIAHLKSKVYNPHLSKSEVAGLSKLCVAAEEQGDEIARGILLHAVDEMVTLVETALRRLDIIGQDVDCVLVGGMTRVSFIYDRFSHRLHQMSPGVNIIRPEGDPVIGALKLAMGT